MKMSALPVFVVSVATASLTSVTMSAESVRPAVVLGGSDRALVVPHHPLGHRGIGAMYIRVRTPNGIMYINRDRFYQMVDLDGTVDEEPVTSVDLPAGSVIVGLPKGFSTLLYEGSTLFYHEGVFFAQKNDDGFEVIQAPVQAIVKDLPTYADPFELEGVDYYEYRNTVYRPFNQYGKTVYEVVKIEPESVEFDAVEGAE